MLLNKHYTRSTLAVKAARSEREQAWRCILAGLEKCVFVEEKEDKKLHGQHKRPGIGSRVLEALLLHFTLTDLI
jgi:hypothetical protein